MKVIRTYNISKNWEDSMLDDLQKLLDEGYIVKFTSVVGNDYVEYILEKTF